MMPQDDEPENYDPALYEERMLQSASAFPVGLEVPGTEAPAEPGTVSKNLGYSTPPEEDLGPENEQDKLDRETCWHHLANPNKPLTPRHWEFCRLLAMGHPHWKIHELMGYSRCYISILSCHPKIRNEVSRLQGVVFERTIEDRFKQMNHRALDVVEEVIKGEDQDIKIQDRLRAATWLLEKTTGKAKQEIETKGGGLADFMTLLRQAADESKVRSESGDGVPQTLGSSNSASFIDVTPEKKEKDPLASWVDANT
jgi:hypothetical protein